jgi:NAD(P)H-hydrate epimerase
MIKVVDVETIRAIEAEADSAGHSYAQMMERAGMAVAYIVLERIRLLSNSKVIVLVGSGNNGGDGLVAARHIAQTGKALVRAYLLKERDPETDLVYKAALDAGVHISWAVQDRDGRELQNAITSADVVIDALFGIGVKLPLRAEASRLLHQIFQALSPVQMPIHSFGTVNSPTEFQVEVVPRPWVIAVDCPSGLDCDSGESDASTIMADDTVTFIAAKPGLFTFPGATAVGRLHIASIDLPDSLPPLQEANTFVVDSKLIFTYLPQRPLDANKGTFGKVMVVAGSRPFSGAVALASLASYRVGSGLVTIAALESIVESLRAALLEPTWLPLAEDNGGIAGEAAQIVADSLKGYDVLLLGPGIGRSSSTTAFVTHLLQHVMELLLDDSANSFKLLLDADALNILSTTREWWQQIPASTILTPHPGEMARLAGTDTASILADRWSLVREKAMMWNTIIVLKGAHTLIAEPGGKIAVIPFKTDALAKAGTGDVLAGMIAGFLAQGLEPFQAAIVGAYIHGAAGLDAVEKIGSGRSVLASDVIHSIGSVLSHW